MKKLTIYDIDVTVTKYSDFGTEPHYWVHRETQSRMDDSREITGKHYRNRPGRYERVRAMQDALLEKYMKVEA